MVDRNEPVASAPSTPAISSLPWRIGSASGHTGKARVVRPDGRTICRMEYDSTEADARFIVTAANSHHELIAACKAALDWHGIDGFHINEPVRGILLAAIAKAEAK